MEIVCTFQTEPDESQSDEEAQAVLAAPSAGAPLPMPIAARQIVLKSAELLMLTGPNGVGKSGFLSELAAQIGHSRAVETFFGNRLIHFPTEEIEQMPMELSMLYIQLRQSVTRYRNPLGEQHLRSIVRRTTRQQLQSDYDIVSAQKGGATFEAARAGNVQLLDLVNEVFRAGELDVEVVIRDGMLKAKRGESIYGIDRLSDGERAALLLVSAVLIQPAEAFVIVDEPERHLNRAIAGALLAALIRTREDIGFIFSTHDLELIEWLQPAQLIHLRGSTMINVDPEQRRYNFAVLDANDGLPDELRQAVLGSRRRLLLVEGERHSYDRALYALVYQNWHVVGRGGWEAVANGVKALDGHQRYHWLQVAGIVDLDGRDPNERAVLAERGIHCLRFPSIENVFLHPYLLEQMAGAFHDLKGGPDAAERMAMLPGMLGQLLDSKYDELLAKAVVWEVQRELSARKPSINQVRSGLERIEGIELEPVRERLAKELDDVRASGSLERMLLEVPIKSTSIPVSVCRAIGYESFDDYRQSLIRQVETGKLRGPVMLDLLSAMLPRLGH